MPPPVKRKPQRPSDQHEARRLDKMREFDDQTESKRGENNGGDGGGGAERDRDKGQRQGLQPVAVQADRHREQPAHARIEAVVGAQAQEGQPRAPINAGKTHAGGESGVSPSRSHSLSPRRAGRGDEWRRRHPSSSAGSAGRGWVRGGEEDRERRGGGPPFLDSNRNRMRSSPPGDRPR